MFDWLMGPQTWAQGGWVFVACLIGFPLYAAYMMWKDKR